ncbi:RICIN domain-containing protein [Nocardiopsis aegyptia]|uniref:Lysophospholipase L1-like esterase n=1 Tax=Nocardiopsis aegyptia TaxID=220378 RepID=A0A7Z0JA87_9ACTN|nr:RICIN domain-containing protein [Nocardiopsis aegyptia]NYJ34170.1 lysophospholipase L1-like esterase [Nocardiopsis aegyptia]
MPPLFSSPRRTRGPSRLRTWATSAIATVVAMAGLVVAAPAASADEVDANTWFTLRNVHSGLVLDVDTGSTEPGAGLVQSDHTGAAHQQFRFLPSGSGAYRLQARHSDQVVDVARGSAEDGADIVQWPDRDNANQRWSATVDGDRVTLVNEGSGKALEVWARSTEPAARVSQYTPNGGANQQWDLVPVIAGGGGDGSPTDPAIHYFGRWDTRDSGAYVPGWAGAYLETSFTGTSVAANQRGTIDLYYSVDGGPYTWLRDVSGTVTLADGLADGEHTLRLGYREVAGSYTGDAVFRGLAFDPGAGTVASTPPDRVIEFVGDSITVGQPNGNRPFTSYPWLVGERLGAGHTQIAQGGACLLPSDCYGMLDWFLRTSSADGSPAWDFRYDAAAVVINLGTNDIGRRPTSEEFRDGYVELIARARAEYPTAEIFALRTFRGRYTTETEEAVRIHNDRGDGGVRFVDTTGWIGDEHLVDSVHPNEAGHRVIADRLTPIIGGQLG